MRLRRQATSLRTIVVRPEPEVTQDRIDILEFKVAHLEQALQEMSDVLYRQQRELDTLRERSQHLLQQVQQLDDRGADSAGVEIPPHY